MAISTKEDFHTLEKDIDFPSFKQTMATLCVSDPTGGKKWEEFFAQSDHQFESVHTHCFLCGGEKQNHRNKESKFDDFVWNDAPIIRQFINQPGGPPSPEIEQQLLLLERQH